MLEPVGVKGVVVVLIWILEGSGHMVSGAPLTLGLWTPRCPHGDPRISAHIHGMGTASPTLL